MFAVGAVHRCLSESISQAQPLHLHNGSLAGSPPQWLLHMTLECMQRDILVKRVLETADQEALVLLKKLHDRREQCAQRRAAHILTCSACCCILG